jgi:D-alanyl-D-alanine carboxypeptidase/D-alanyl-D-alanine-endopeptidase (penicillin-binding protein 4)
MKPFLRAAVGSSFLILSNPSFATLQSDLDHIVQSARPPAHMGVVVRQAQNGNVLYSTEGQSLFAPASVQKLVTATAALIGLGADFCFKTELLTNGRIEQGELYGDLTLRFSGDPELNSAAVNQLLATLTKQGVKRIHGHLYLDTSTYDGIPYPPGWLWDDLSYSYAAPLSTANLNKNRFFVQITPGAVGQHPTITSSLPNSVAQFTNHMITTDKYYGDCPITVYSDLDNHFIFYGCVPKTQQAFGRSLALRNPVPYAAFLMTHYLQTHGIQFNSAVSTTRIDTRYHVLATHSSVPLHELLKHMLKKSDNLISNSLMKQLGYQVSGRQGSWINGKAAIAQILRKYVGIDTQKVLMDDGAGMSRYNLLTPNMLTVLLNYIYRQPESFRSVLIDDMPIAGIDGTLRGRMPNLAKGKRVHAKTGTMTGVSALTGFVFSEHLGPVSFAIITNGYIGKGRRYKALEDRICQRLAQ